MFLSKYGVARHIFIPLVKRSLVDFAVGADYSPAAGDVKISKDGGAAANVTNLPVAIVMGNTAMWDFSLTATEMQAAQVDVTIADAATKAVEDSMFVIQTFGNAAAQIPFDLSQATPKVDVDTIKTNPVVNAGTVTFPTSATLASTGNLTGGTITTVANVSDKTGYTLSSAGIDAVFDRADGIETGWTLRQVLRIMAAVLLGKCSGAGGNTITYRDLNDTKNRVVASDDADGDRSTVTKDAT